jgi:hypothetical protein
MGTSVCAGEGVKGENEGGQIKLKYFICMYKSRINIKELF